jgi:hypothetical protein
MPEKDAKQNQQKDKNLAAETRPVPSQAEGDEETVDESLEEHAKKGN